MKTKLFILSFGLLVVACGNKDKSQLAAKKAELETLKKQSNDLNLKVTTLEAEIAKLDTSKKVLKSIEVVALPLTPKIFKTYIEVQGKVDAEENVSVTSEIPGTLTKINVKVGQTVSKGELLAETDTRAMQQQLQDLQINYELTKQIFTKQENLWNQKIGTEVQYLQAKATKESMEKKISAVQEQIRMSRITSPIDGTVDGINVKVGQAVMPGVPAISVVNFNNLKVKADIAESYISRIKIGNEVQLYFPDINDSTFAKVNYASRAINVMSRTFAVEMLLDNKKEYHPNSVARVRINDYQSEKPILVLPTKYIQKMNGEVYTVVAENGKVVKKTLTLGKEYKGLIEVLGGLTEQDLIITDGFDLVIEGDNVIVKNIK